MKLDFFDRLFGRERKERPVELIDSSQLREWLGGQLKSRRDGIYGECRPLVDDVFRDLKAVKALTLNLEKLECPEDLPKKARKIVLTSRPAFVQGILDTLSLVGEGKPSGYDELMKFHTTLQAAVSSLGKIGFGQGRYLPIAFGEEIDDIRRKAKKLFERSEKLREKIGSDVNLLSEALDTLSEIELRRKELIDLKAEKSKIKNKIERCKTENSSLKREIDPIQETREFRELKKVEGELREIRAELESVELEIYNHINPLKRSMKKFRKFAEVKGHPPEVLKNIEEHMQNPVDCFLSDEDGKLDTILKEIRKAIESGDFRLKDRDKGKIIARIESTLNLDRDKLKGRYLKLKAREEDLSGKIESSPVTVKRKELERDLEHLVRDNIKETLSRKKKKLENKLKGVEVKINWKN
jgi:hypothetical protein